MSSFICSSFHSFVCSFVHSSVSVLWIISTVRHLNLNQSFASGNSAALDNELMARIMYNKTAWKLIKSVAIGSTSSVMNIEVEVTKDFPLVSLVSMLAPSPDWFTGIKKVPLCNTSSGLWLDSWTTDMLHPWDAGTDDGATFDAPMPRLFHPVSLPWSLNLLRQPALCNYLGHPYQQWVKWSLREQINHS